MNKITYFFKHFYPEMKAEMKKVTFPSRDEVQSTTWVVIITSVIFAVFLWASDEVIVRLYNALHRVLA